MSSQKVSTGPRKGRPSPIPPQLRDDLSQSSLLSKSSLERSDSMSSIASIEMDKDSKGDAKKVKKVTKKKKSTIKDSKENGKAENGKDSTTTVKKKVKSTTEVKTEQVEDASSLRSRLKPSPKKEPAKEETKPKADDGKAEATITPLKKLRPAPGKNTGDPSKPAKPPPSTADDVRFFYKGAIRLFSICNAFS
ncbi:unnamed protein product [Cylicostephanus goldi]|uniref:Uncharacterized protein n=1 Tax=Cylicostephanus goldi TaxID=71465 RepID=A0A3P6SF08_CYLGO|nr:unnamed protein product [Cylicostephanus goldi]